ncbi:unnamed protein product [Lupinus luteus]|uniref:Uncharacterized protein n=1 Tax=Lupinus luteus TaxID=3873 RepID=A0AAV1WQ77_LUPLU
MIRYTFPDLYGSDLDLHADGGFVCWNSSCRSASKRFGDQNVDLNISSCNSTFLTVMDSPVSDLE